MDREHLIKECVLLTCFLENINTNDRERLCRLVKSLNEYTDDRLKEFHEVNSRFTDRRLDLIIKSV